MDARTLTIRIAGMVMLWLLSVAPGIFASATGEPPRRQTEFSDRNYQPSRQINISVSANKSAPVSHLLTTPHWLHHYPQ